MSFARQLLQVGRAAQRTGSSLRFNQIQPNSAWNNFLLLDKNQLPHLGYSHNTWN
ncbi:hypothetical protein PN497_02990 [Sphaerospermopsis kisseleviana CS-549]|uniref:Transposase n=1 Tax=Sphaerospermopsis kisseleviana CS-549 TaxID=3021783 RepID=A0ABT4ZNK6_9CYAN|nr:MULTISPECIES: hypothetical protein [Sphaerospermopsis]MBD2133635.1 hypothetical protein [Sphaerospermopsis sp. FACHB-1094]MDB9440347.1 hypothetical protein [Sphaerospermopsis kisseleviana CS-549]